MPRNIQNPTCSFLKKLISPYGFGCKDAFGYRRPTNKALIDDYNRNGYIRGLNNAQLLDHFRGNATYYFWGDGRVKTPYALICIDIDCHKLGTLGAAQAFAQHLRDTSFPGLYFEPSTGGKGVHGYVLIDKRGFGDERLYGLAKLLDRSLKVVHKGWQANNPALVVEGVETKGHPPRISWNRHGQMEELISGQFAKLPRMMLSRFDEFTKTTVLNDRQISQLSMRFKDESVVSGKPVVELAKARGSLTGCVVKRCNLDRWDAYLAVARKLVATPLTTTGREVATAEDMAVMLMILEACTKAMNADGSMPTARIGENWEILHAHGDVNRPWCPRRFAALRNLLSTQGFIDWKDAHYLPAALSPDGKGQAAKWRASEALMNLIETEKRGPQANSAVVQDEGDAAIGDLGSVFLRIGDREEDLYCDTIQFLPDTSPESAWMIKLRRHHYVRPLLDVGVDRLRMAA